MPRIADSELAANVRQRNRVNSAAVSDPGLIDAIADAFGAQALVVAIGVPAARPPVIATMPPDRLPIWTGCAKGLAGSAPLR